jgi:hypothetical protein
VPEDVATIDLAPRDERANYDPEQAAISKPVNPVQHSQPVPSSVLSARSRFHSFLDTEFTECTQSSQERMPESSRHWTDPFCRREQRERRRHIAKSRNWETERTNRKTWKPPGRASSE